MRFTKKWMAKFIHNSNLIENYYLPMDHLMMVLKGEVPGSSPHILNHIKGLDYVKKFKKTRPTIDSVCHLHKILLGDLDGRAGKMRKGPVMVGHHIPPNWQFILFHLDHWIQFWDMSPFVGMNPERQCRYRHYEFEWIHPFDDGNGRLGRLLYLWDSLYHDLEPEIILAKDKEKHYYDPLTSYSFNDRGLLLRP